MPGVRYGPDISDDAAYLVDSVRAIQEKLRRGIRLSRTESTRLTNARDFAGKIFGVSREDFDRGRFGEMGEMARYGAARDRSRYALSWRSKDVMKKSVQQEFEDRARGVDSRGSKIRPAEGTYYVGRTKTKRFRQLEANAQRRMNESGYKLGNTIAAPGSVTRDNFKATVDRFNVARTSDKTSYLLQRERGGTKAQQAKRLRTTRSGSAAGFSIRPPLAKSQQRQRQRQRRRDGGGGAPGAGGAAASSRRAGPQQARRARNVRNATRPRRP